MAHTPGPWIVIPRIDNNHCEGIFGPDGTAIVETDSGYYAPEIDDAYLIAAAPDLLTAARLTVLHFKRTHASGGEQGDDEHEAWTALDAAIAKAEGR